MKIRTYKKYMNRALLWYTEQLTKMHMGNFLTPARLELITRDLIKLQLLQQSRESNTVWQVPVKILPSDNNVDFKVVVADENNILYLDE